MGEQGATICHWYLGATCKRCGTAMLFAPSRGPDHEIPPDAHVHASCPTCGLEADYTGADLKQLPFGSVK
jgi:hypothetical protein